MVCPFCRHENSEERPRCERCGSDLPRPVCQECGVLVEWNQALCWRCDSLGSDTERVAIGSGWQVHGIATPLVGRTREIHVLNQLLKTAIEERAPQAATIVGDTGMGKSRLVAEFNSQLDKHFDVVTVARGDCREEGGPPYLLFGRLLRNRFYIATADEPEQARRKLIDGIKAVTPGPHPEEAAHLLGHLIGLPFPDSPYLAGLTDSPRRLEQAAFEALLNVLASDAQRVPLVLVLEDLHHASAESLVVVDLLLSRLRDAQLLVICTATASMKDDPPSYWSGEAPHTVVDLKPLSDEECGRLLADILHQVNDLPKRLVDIACERAIGNPYTLESIVRLFLENGVVEVGPESWTVHEDRLNEGTIPESQPDVVRARLDALSDHEREVLEKASVIGHGFWYGALTMLDRIEGQEWPEEERHWNSGTRDDALKRVLRSLRKKDIIRRAPTCRFSGDREYVFKHRLERKLMYPAPDEQRAAMHNRVAQWLEFRSSSGTGRPPIEDIARHYELAGLPHKAAYYHIHAGDLARERFLNDKAIEAYKKGLDCLGDTDRVAMIEALHNLGNVYFLLGQQDEALCYYREMLRHAWALANKAKGGVAFHHIGRVYRALGEYDFAHKHLERARQLFEDVGDMAGIASSLDDIGRIYWLHGELDTALELHQEALVIRRELDTPRSVALSLAHVGSIHVVRGEFAKGLELLRESLELRRETGDLRGVAESLNALAVIFYEREQYEEARKIWREALDAACEVGVGLVRAKIQNNLGEACMELGDLDEASERLNAALALTDQTGARGIRVDVLRNLGRLSMLQGEIGDAVECCERALAIAEESGLRLLEGIVWATLGEVHSQVLFDPSRSGEGPQADADRCFSKAIETLTDVGNKSYLARALRTYGNVLLERGDTDRGREHLQQAKDIFGDLEIRGVDARTEALLAEVAPGA